VTTSDQRDDPRLHRRERAYIRVLLGDGAALLTETEDISRGGFRALLSEPVAVGSILHVVVELQTSKVRFLLAAEVRWCQSPPATDNSAEKTHCAGFALLDASGSDYDAWREFAEPDAVDPA